MQPLVTGMILFLLCPALFAASQLPEPVVWRLLPQAQVHGAGIYLNELIDNPPAPLPHLRLAPAPSVGQPLQLTRAQITDLVRQVAPELATTHWSGAPQIRVTRQLRPLEEREVKELLSAALQRDYVKERGELELRFTRPWTTVQIADDPFTLQVLDLPSAGVTPNLIVRFELRADNALLGNWQAPVQARIWRDVWVAGSPLLRGQLLRDADVVRQRRDVLSVRDALPALNLEDRSLELAENISAGLPLTLRSLRPRPIIQRGKFVEAVIQDGAMTISTRAEVLEDGLPGQLVRARNLKTKREFRGKVQNEETILVAF